MASIVPPSPPVNAAPSPTPAGRRPRTSPTAEERATADGQRRLRCDLFRTSPFCRRCRRIIDILAELRDEILDLQDADNAGEIERLWLAAGLPTGWEEHDDAGQWLASANEIPGDAAGALWAFDQLRIILESNIPRRRKGETDADDDQADGDQDADAPAVVPAT